MIEFILGFVVATLINWVIFAFLVKDIGPCKERNEE